MGRLLRGPDDPDPDPSLVTEPPKPDPVDPPVDPNVPPVDPNKPPEPDPNKPPEPEAAVPLTVEDLVIPEGYELVPELATEFLEIFNREMDPKDRVNALVGLHTKAIQEASEASSKLFEDTQTEWKEEVKADPEIGGAELQPTLTNVQKLMDEFGTQELKDVFNLTGAGNNIHMIKFLNIIADKLTEGKFFKAGSPAGADDPDAAASRMFPSMKG